MRLGYLFLGQRGRKGRPGAQGAPGRNGINGEKGNKGEKGKIIRYKVFGFEVGLQSVIHRPELTNNNREKRCCQSQTRP